MSTQPDWRHEIEAHATARGVHLSAATVTELAEHLDDIHSAAVRDGCSPGAARARAIAALEESPMEVLRGHAARTDSPGRASTSAVPATGKRLNVPGALRLAVRQLRRRPAFAAVTILVLALGIGASTAVFSIVDSVLLGPVPYRQPDRLLRLWDAHIARGLTHQQVSPVNFMDYRELQVFDDAAAWWRPSLDLVDPGLQPLRVNAIETTSNLFAVLGVAPQLGQDFRTDGRLFAREPAVIISDRLWRTRYSSDPGIVGRQLRFGDRPHTVAGVMPPRFHYPDDIDVWQQAAWDFRQHSRGAHFMEAVARLAEGVTIEQARVASTQLSERLGTEFPATNSGWTPDLVPLVEDELGYYRPALFVLVGAVGLVLIVGCLNVASLLLTRALSREREVAVRIAIGASPRQLITQLLAESLVLSAAGAALGVLAATVALPALAGMAPAGIPRLDVARIDVRALAVAAVVAVTTTIVFGLVPAMVVLGRRSGELRPSERGSTRGTRRAYSVLVAGQMALACSLLIASALLIRTVARMVDTPTGIDADEVVTASIQLPLRGPNWPITLAQWDTMARTHTALLERIREQPGVHSAGATNFLPLAPASRLPFVIEGEQAPVRSDEQPRAQQHTVTDGYFETMRASLTQGRFLSPLDTDRSPGVVVVNDSFVARYLQGGRSPLGRVITTTTFTVGSLGRNLLIPVPARQGQPPATARFEIVGVVGDVRNVPLGDAVEPAIYFSARQFPFRETTFTVRADTPAAAADAIRTALEATLPETPMGVVRTWGKLMAAHTAEPRLLMVLLVFFGATAGLLAALGVYGLFSWSVAQRTRELAIRLTLGARPASVGADVIRHSVGLIAVGLVAGLLIVRLAEETLTRVLFELSPRDPIALTAASTLLAVVALAACVPPALRALRVDPVEGLRTE